MITKKLNGIRAKVFKKEVEKVRDEVLGKKEATSLKRLFSRFPQGRLTSTIILVSLVLSACDYFPPTEKTVTETLVKPTISETMPATETAMVDETPWIELTPTATETVAPTATETAEPTPTVEATSAIFSKEYPVLWKESYTAEVGGMEIPIDIGLNYSIMYRSSEPITEIHIAEDVVDMVGDYFMHTCFWRYTQIMDHSDVTYEQYLELVAKGEGMVEFAAFDNDLDDQEKAEITLVDPRKGFSLTFANEDLRIKMNTNYSVDFINSHGKIMMIGQMDSKQISNYKSYGDESIFDSVLSVVTLRNLERSFNIFGGGENRCLLLSTSDESRFYFEFCGEFNPSILLKNYSEPLENESALRHKNDGEELFTVKQN